MKRLAFVLLVGSFALTGCQQNQSAPPDDAYEGYGAQMTSEGATPVRAVAQNADQHDGKQIKVQGMVHRVCQKKGCWLTLDAGSGHPVRVLVARSDSGYVFTVPKDIDGREAVVRGTLKRETLSEQARNHLAEDDAAADSASVPEREVRITADGVLVKKQATTG